MFKPQGKVSKDQIDRIYQLIKQQPGIKVRQVSEQTGIGFATTKSGINFLVDAGKVKKRTDGDRCVQVFPVGGE